MLALKQSTEKWLFSAREGRLTAPAPPGYGPAMDDVCEQQVLSVTPADNTGSNMTVVLSLQILWSDTKLNSKLYLHIFCIWNPDISQGKRLG